MRAANWLWTKSIAQTLFGPMAVAPELCFHAPLGELAPALQPNLL